MFASLQRNLFLLVTRLTFQPQHLFLRCLSGLSEHGLGLSSITLQFHVIPPLAKGLGVTFTSFVLSDLVSLMTSAILVLAVRLPHFRYVNHH